MLSSPTTMGITGFNAFGSVIHFRISPATCQGQAADAVAAFAVPCFTENLEYCQPVGLSADLQTQRICNLVAGFD